MENERVARAVWSGERSSDSRRDGSDASRGKFKRGLPLSVDLPSQPHNLLHQWHRRLHKAQADLIRRCRQPKTAAVCLSQVSYTASVSHHSPRASQFANCAMETQPNVVRCHMKPCDGVQRKIERREENRHVPLPSSVEKGQRSFRFPKHRTKGYIGENAQRFCRPQQKRRCPDASL